MNALAKTEQGITPTGHYLLDLLKETWKDEVVTKKTVVLCPETQQPTWGEIEVSIESKNKRLNKGIAPEVFHYFGQFVREEDQERIQSIIERGGFEVIKAIQAFDIAPKVVTTKTFKPTTWSEAEAVNSPSLVTLAKYKGNKKAVALVFAMLFSFARKFGKRNDLTEELLEELATDIVEQYKRLSVADLKMLLNRALKNTKKLFNLDYQSIMQLLDEGMEEKRNYGSEKTITRHKELTYEEKGSRTTEGLVHSMSLKQQLATIKLHENG